MHIHGPGQIRGTIYHFCRLGSGWIAQIFRVFLSFSQGFSYHLLGNKAGPLTGVDWQTGVAMSRSSRGGPGVATRGAAHGGRLPLVDGGGGGAARRAREQRREGGHLVLDGRAQGAGRGLRLRRLGT